MWIWNGLHQRKMGDLLLLDTLLRRGPDLGNDCVENIYINTRSIKSTFGYFIHVSVQSLVS